MPDSYVCMTHTCDMTHTCMCMLIICNILFKCLGSGAVTHIRHMSHVWIHSMSPVTTHAYVWCDSNMRHTVIMFGLRCGDTYESDESCCVCCDRTCQGTHLYESYELSRNTLIWVIRVVKEHTYMSHTSCQGTHLTWQFLSQHTHLCYDSYMWHIFVMLCLRGGGATFWVRHDSNVWHTTWLTCVIWLTYVICGGYD